VARTSATWRARAFAVLAACGVGQGVASVALAADPSFGPHDLRTLFYISKSDDKNRVDYGMRLTAECTPAKKDAVFPYWHEFEHSPPVTHSLGFFEYNAYGVSRQIETRRKPTGTEYQVELKPVDRPIWVTVTKEADGSCKALVRTPIAGIRYAELLSIYVKLAGPMSVSYIVVKGRDLATGRLIEERINH
jgi:hypothetical protein